jgi:hypothetical protein
MFVYCLKEIQSLKGQAFVSETCILFYFAHLTVLWVNLIQIQIYCFWVNRVTDIKLKLEM